MQPCVLAAALLSVFPASGHERRARECALYPKHQPFKEPPVVTASSKIVLTVETVALCSPFTGNRWITRAFGCPSAGYPPMVPGVTLRVKPGESLRIKLRNKLGRHNPSPQRVDQIESLAKKGAIQFRNSRIENVGWINSTNLHTHGLHTTSAAELRVGNRTYAADSVFVMVDPGEPPMNYYIPVRADHMAGTHWYHPHHHHSTSVQVGGGMHGALIVEDPSGSLPPEISSMEEKIMVISLIDLRNFRMRSFAGMGFMENQGRGKLWTNLNGKRVGRYVTENQSFALVNGMWRPKLEIKGGVWYRLRLIFASIEDYLRMAVTSTEGLRCDLRLLAKDGIYLNVAPRKIERIYLASGNRADVAIRCRCPSPVPCSGSLESTKQNPHFLTLNTTIDRITHIQDPFNGVLSEALDQELVHLSVTQTPESSVKPPLVPAPKEFLGVPRSGELRSFILKRPCYLVDLTGVNIPLKNWGRIDFWSPLDDEDSGWKVTWSDWFHKFKGLEMIDMDAPPLFELNVGEVYQFYVRGPKVLTGGIGEHPYHLHVLPSQIHSLNNLDPFWKIGDWCDTLLHIAGQVVVRVQTDTYIGRYVIHCHILTHEDMGMMSYFSVKGKEGTIWKGAEKVDPSCYRTGGQTGWRYATDSQIWHEEKGPSQVPHWVKGPPGHDCHRACSLFGGCTGQGWPSTGPDFEDIARDTAAYCTVSPIPFSVTGTSAAYNPSYSFDGKCRWKYQPEFQSETVDSDLYRCGTKPPKTVARFCPCNEAPKTDFI